MKLIPTQSGFLLPFGSKVVVDNNQDLPMIVLGYALYPSYRQVQCGWWCNGDAKSTWFDEWRVEALKE